VGGPTKTVHTLPRSVNPAVVNRLQKYAIGNATNYEERHATSQPNINPESVGVSKHCLFCIIKLLYGNGCKILNLQRRSDTGERQNCLHDDDAGSHSQHQ